MTGTTIRSLRILGALALAACIPPAFGDTSAEWPAGLTLQGFGTVGMARSSNPNANIVRDLSQPDGVTNVFSARIDSLLGLQANYVVSDTLEAVIQGVSHYRYDASFSPELTWAFVKYSPTPNLSFRAGRIGTEFYMLADSRLVGYSLLTVRPPGDFFGTLPFNYVDGMDARLSLKVGHGVLRADVYSGLTREKLPLEDKIWPLNGSPLSGAGLEYQTGPWTARLSYAHIDFANDLPLSATLPAAVLNALKTAGTRGAFRSFGMVYDDGSLQVQGAVARTTRQSLFFEDDYSGYAIAGYRIRQVTPFIGYSWVFSSPKSAPTSLSAGQRAIATSLMSRSHSDQRTTIVGARWDAARNVALKVQYDMQRGTGQSIFTTRRELPGWDGCTNILTVSLDFVF